jgi:hypothetical protein
MLNFLIINLAIVIRRRQTPHVKETSEVINVKIDGNEDNKEDVTFRTGTVPDTEPCVLVDDCKRYTW